MDIKHLQSPLDRLTHWANHRPNTGFLSQPFGEKMVDYSWQQVQHQVQSMAAYLVSLDLPPGSSIGIFSKNCAHWVMADLAIMLSGHVSVPLYPTLAPETIHYTLSHSDSRLLFVGRLDDWQTLQHGIPSALPLVAFPYQEFTNATQWDAIVEKYSPLKHYPTLTMADTATIIYTSGTTGHPKGVMHSLASLASAATGYLERFKTHEKDRMFSYLPMSHVAERSMVEMQMLYCGGSIRFADTLHNFANHLQATQPTIFGAVPRIWVKFQQRIQQKAPPYLSFLLGLPVIGGLIGGRICHQMGLGKVRYAFSGAAPIPRQLLAWYQRLGLNIAEGYGLTENMAYSHMGVPGDHVLGSVGRPLPGVITRIAENNEVQVKSPSTMQGYYKDPEQTQQALTEDGFLRTGDQGKIDDDGFLHITGRVKDLFKTAKGKYVSPTPIELTLANHPLVDNVCVVGSGLAQPLALVCLDLSQDHDQQQQQTTLETLLQSCNQTLDPHERLATLVVISEPWTVENKLLTPTLKVRRSRIESHYQDQLEDWLQRGTRVIFA